MRMRCLGVLCGIWAAGCATALAAAPVRGQLPAVLVEQGPKLDGTMADPLWAKGAELIFGAPAKPQPDPAGGTTGRVLFDKDHVYIGVRCAAGDVKATVTERDGEVWKDDCVEVFVTPDLDEGYYHVAVNALGTVCDEHCGPFAKDAGRNLAVRAKASIEKGKGWTVTLAIPLGDLSAQSGEDLPWRLNVTRTQHAHGGESYREHSWAHLGTDQFHSPGTFGRVSGLSLPPRPRRQRRAPSPGTPAERGQVRAVMVDKGPAIDGTLADPIWAKGALLVLGDPESTDQDPMRRTKVRLLFDAQNLYLAALCAEDETETIVARQTRRDGPIWDDDCVEFYVAPDAWSEYYQFIVNSTGAVFDQRVRKGRKDSGFNAGARVKTAIDAGRAWSVTMAIPLKDLNAFVGKGLTWRLNATRYRQRRKGQQATTEFSWSEIGPGGFHDPFHFGTVAGVNIPKTPGGVTREVDPDVIWFTPRPKTDSEVMLQATADIWLSAVGEEQLNSMGKAPHFKLKTCQEAAVVRFDPGPVRGREVKKATLYMRREGGDQLRRFRISTVGQTWKEGSTVEDYGAPSGACFSYADVDAKKRWAWDDSTFWDVSFGSGHSLGGWTESTKHRNGWISVPLRAELVYAMATGSTDGIALAEGGTLSYYNNFLHSAQSKGSEPRIIVELGGPLAAAPARPSIKAEPAPRRAGLTSGAIRVTIQQAKGVFCHNVKLNGKPVDRWRVAYPAGDGPTVMLLDDLPPSSRLEVEVTAVSPGGKASEPAKCSVAASPALPLRPELAAFSKPTGGAVPKPVAGRMRVWPLPGLVRISPEKPQAMSDDIGGEGDYRAANAVWNGKAITLWGARGEYVSYQLCIEALGGVLKDVRVLPSDLTGPGGAVIGEPEIELYKNWYVRNAKKLWEPSYAVPLKHGAPLAIPDPTRNLATQRNQTITVDVYVPKDARSGRYTGRVTVAAGDVRAAASLPIELTVWDFVLPDKLSFWPELNAYNIPGRREGSTLDYHRLAHQHRCVLNTCGYRPKTTGSGTDTKVDWSTYDAEVGPLLSGEAFKHSRRAGVPTPCLYLPYGDSWPGPLSRKTYRYDGPWPGRDGNQEDLITHFLTAPYIGDGLTPEYKDAFLAVQRQFIEHFRQKGWNQTEMQCFYGGKMWFRIKWGSNCWWTTDEPYHLDDWLALQFFCRLWTQGRKANKADPKLWAARGDISRPWNQGHLMDGAVNCVYYGAGGFSDEGRRRRCRILAEQGGFSLRNYGSGGARGMSAMLVLWINGSNAMLPWQTLGPDKALDIGDAATHGAAILVPGKRFGLPVVGDLRLKMFREGQQIIEYLVLFQKKHDLTREQIGGLLRQRMRVEYSRATDARTDDADATRGNVVKAWELVELRKALAEQIVKR